MAEGLKESKKGKIKYLLIAVVLFILGGWLISYSISEECLENGARSNGRVQIGEGIEVNTRLQPPLKSPKISPGVACPEGKPMMQGTVIPIVGISMMILGLIIAFEKLYRNEKK